MSSSEFRDSSGSHTPDISKESSDLFYNANSEDSYGSDAQLLNNMHKSPNNEMSLSHSHEYDIESVLGNAYLPPEKLYPWLWVPSHTESDDHVHDPSAKPEFRDIFSFRGFFNIGTILVIVLSALMLFAGYPLLDHFLYGKKRLHDMESISETRQMGPPQPESNNTFRWTSARKNVLIDPDTPPEARTIISTYSGQPNKTLELVFSDEFNEEGRSFYPGDDIFWEAVDLHDWVSNDYEWYSPEAVTTRNGALEIRLERFENHLRNFRGGMLQSWNKVCFTGGLIMASIQLPGNAGIDGMRSAFWMMGNLGRAGHGATLQGVWPYSYDRCDEGTLMNQTFTYDPGTPYEAGNVAYNSKNTYATSAFLPGQRLSACTCPDDDHPGPKLEDGTWKGRSAPEMDIMVARNSSGDISVSQSCQMAPYNYLYNITAQDPEMKHNINNTEAYRLFSPRAELDGNAKGKQPQLLSATSPANQTTVQGQGSNRNSFANYSIEYKPGSDGWVSWTNDGRKTWEIYSGALDPAPNSPAGKRTFSQEPMYLIFNLGLMNNDKIDWDKMTKTWDELGPLTMRVDWVRVYQDPSSASDHTTSCSPPKYPTVEYIDRHYDAYHNPNLTVWGIEEDGSYGAKWPRNRLHANGKGCDIPAMGLPGDPATPRPYPVATSTPRRP